MTLNPLDVEPVLFFFDAAQRTKTLCKCGLLFSWVLGFACLGASLYFRIGHPQFTKQVSASEVLLPVNRYFAEGFVLALNIILTLSNEATGYIHTVSLRWALQRENRLIFNSNLRLFTSSRTSRLNSWFINLLFLICLVLSYASTALILVPISTFLDSNQESTPLFHLSIDAAFNLSFSILIQTFLATLCFKYSHHVPTWSCSPLDTAAACVSIEPTLTPSVGYNKIPSTSPEVIDTTLQENLWSMNKKEVSRVVYTLWTTVLICLLWFVATILVVRLLEKHDQAVFILNGGNWSVFPVVNKSDISTLTEILSSVPEGDLYPSGPFFAQSSPAISMLSGSRIDHARLTGLLAMIIIFQTPLTASLHCAELLVNSFRDETTWRKAVKSGNITTFFQSNENAFFSAIKSPPALILFFAKPVLHWLYNLSMTVDIDNGIIMRPAQISYLTITATILAISATVCTFWKPKGFPPSTFGHLHRIMDYSRTITHQPK